MKSKQKVTPRRVAFNSNESLNKFSPHAADLQPSLEGCQALRANQTKDFNSESVTKRPMTDEEQISGESNEEDDSEELRDNEQEEIPSKSRQHGFQRPFHSWQIMSWVFYLLPLGVFYSLILTQLEHKAAWACLAGILDTLVLIFGVITTKIDPTDSTVHKTRPLILKKEKHEVPQNTEFCSNCQAYSLLTSKHCGQCNRCVNGFDHHCKWLNNCIGDSNYKLFFILVVWVWMLSTLKFIATLTGVVAYFEERSIFEQNVMEVGNSQHFQFYGLSQKSSGLNLGILIIQIVLLPLEVLIIVGSMQLIIYHICLKCRGLTTYEYLMKKRNLKEKIILPSQEFEVRRIISNYYPAIRIDDFSFFEIINLVDSDPKLKALIFKSRAKSKRGKKKDQKKATSPLPQSYQLSLYDREAMRPVQFQPQTKELPEERSELKPCCIQDQSTKTLGGYPQGQLIPNMKNTGLNSQLQEKGAEAVQIQENGEALLFMRSRDQTDNTVQHTSQFRYKAPLNDSTHSLIKPHTLLYSPANQLNHMTDIIEAEYGRHSLKGEKGSRVVLNSPTQLQKKKLKLDRMSSLSPTFAQRFNLSEGGVKMSNSLSARNQRKE